MDTNSSNQNHIFPEDIDTSKSNNEYVPIISNPEDGNAENLEQEIAIEKDFTVVGEEKEPLQPYVKEKANRFKAFNDFVSKRWWLVLILITAVCVSVLGVYSILKKEAKITSDNSQPYSNVKGTIESPKLSASGTPSKWKVNIQNKENVAILDVVVELNFDKTFKYTEAITPDPADPKGNSYVIKRLEAANQPGSDILIQFNGILSGNIDEDSLMTGKITYTPSPLLNQTNNRRSVSIEAAKTKITAPDINIQIYPDQDTVQTGSEAILNIKFTNTSEREIKDLRISVDYPDKGNFVYKSSELIFSTTNEPKTQPDVSNNIWNIPTMPRLKEQVLKIYGTVNGTDGAKLVFGVSFESKINNNDYQQLYRRSQDIKITSQPLVISTKIEGKDADSLMEPGETLNFVINYENKSANTTLKNVEIIGFVDDPADVFDYNTLNYTSGERGTVTNRTILWTNPAVTPFANLTPGAKGQLVYKLTLKPKEKFFKTGLNQNSYVVTPRAQAKATNLAQVEVTGKPLKTRGEFKFNQQIKQKPPIPGQSNKSYYTVTWTLSNRQNEVKDIVVKTNSTLPVGSWQQASINPAANAYQINYNESTGDIIWKLDKLESYAGISKEVVKISFDFVVTSPVEGGSKPSNLFGEVKITALDDYTGEKYELSQSGAGS